MLVVIPSLSRWNRLLTYKWIPKQYLKNTVIVVPETQAAEYRGHNPDKVILGCPVKGIGPTRDWIVQYARKKGERKVLMLDDDLRFFYRIHPEGKTHDYVKAPPEEMLKAFRIIEKLLNKYPHASIAIKQGSNNLHPTEPVILNTRLLRVLAYDTELLHSERIRFSDIEFMEDFHVSLSLLERGYASATDATHAQDQAGSQMKGGCADYRTMETQAKAAQALKEMHPRFVQVIQRTTKGAWGGGTRTDVRIAWKEAYKEGSLKRTA